MEAIDELMDLFEQMEKEANDNANDLYKEYGNSDTYKNYRIQHYTIGRLFKYDGLKYQVIDVDKEQKLVACKRLGFTFRKAPSGRKLKRYAKFGLSSIMDLKLRFIK